jgi:hypothetical protein
MIIRAEFDDRRASGRGDETILSRCIPEIILYEQRPIKPGHQHGA